MKFRWIKTNWVIRQLFSNYLWHLPNKRKFVYLTFDDGPTPYITNWVLDLLKKYQAKATFFCIGKNIEAQPEIFDFIIKSDHAIGNHTQDHINGWKKNLDCYIDNVASCEKTIKKFSFYKKKLKLFRPPYGKIKPNQSRVLRKKGYTIVMWDVLSADFDQTISKETCLENVLKNVVSGSIVVFHDSQKAFSNLEFVLPKVLDFLKFNGFECKSIV